MQTQTTPDPIPNPLTGLRPLPRLNANWDTPSRDAFVWGPVLAIHRIGDYTAVEYAVDNSSTSGSDMQALRREHGSTRFLGYFRDTSAHDSSTLEGALVEAIVRSKHHVNSQAGSLLMTILRADENDERHPGSTLGKPRSLTRSTVDNPYAAPYWKGEPVEG